MYIGGPGSFLFVFFFMRGLSGADLGRDMVVKCLLKIECLACWSWTLLDGSI